MDISPKKTFFYPANCYNNFVNVYSGTIILLLLLFHGTIHSAAAQSITYNYQTSTDAACQKGVIVGNGFLEKNERDKAKEAFKKAISESPGCSDAISNLAVIYLNEGKIKVALKLFQQALGMVESGSPVYKIVLYNIGVCFMRENNLTQALKYFNTSLQLDQSFRPAAEAVVVCNARLAKVKPPLKQNLESLPK